MMDPWFWWAVLGLVLIGVETFVPGLSVIFFGLGALATALLCAIPPFAAAPALQALFWTAASLAAFFSLRKRLKRLLKGTIFLRDKDGQVDGVAGEAAEVIERIGPDRPGRVHFRGTSWKALAYLEAFEPGETVRVVGREGLALVVTRDFLAADAERAALAEDPNPAAASRGETAIEKREDK